MEPINNDVTKSCLNFDLGKAATGDVGLALADYTLSSLLNDVIFAEYVDADEGTGNLIKRGGLFIPQAHTNEYWRVAKVVLVGDKVKTVKTGDFILFGNDRGIPVGKITVQGYGFVNKGIFLNEERIFGIAAKNTEAE